MRRIERGRRGRIATLPLITAPAACATAVPPVAPSPRGLHTTLDSILDAPPLQRTGWGVLAVDAATGEVLYARNPERNFIPASNTKLVVTLVAMGELGPDWRYRTLIEAAGAGGEVDALIVRGSGDPTFSERFHDTDLAPLDSLAVRIARAGIARVRGDIIIDATRFTDTPIHSAWEVGDLPFGYAPPVAPFAIAEGTFRLERRTGILPGEPVRLRVLHGDSLQPIRSSVTTDTAGARPAWRIDYMRRTDTVHLAGTLPRNVPDTVRLAVTDPERYAGLAFARALRRRGIVVEGGVEVIRDPFRLRERTRGMAPRAVTEIESPPLREIIAAILKPSQNWIAEQLLKTLGAERGEGGTWADGLAVEQRYLTGHVGLDSLAFNLRDASGLSAQNLLSPAAIVHILRHAASAPWARDYRFALPTAGEEAGTLASRLRGYESRVFAKTGTIANVNSLSGYLVRDDGREVVFAIMTNGSGLPSRIVRDAIDAVVAEIARSRGGAR